MEEKGGGEEEGGRGEEVRGRERGRCKKHEKGRGREERKNRRKKKKRRGVDPVVGMAGAWNGNFRGLPGRDTERRGKDSRENKTPEECVRDSC